MFEWFDNLLGKFNSDGIPAPMVRDPKTGKGSITATLVVVSSGICGACCMLAILSALAKAGGVFSSFTEAQQAIQNAFGISFQFFLACGGFHLGHSFQRSEKGAINIQGDDKDGKES